MDNVEEFTTNRINEIVISSDEENVSKQVYNKELLCLRDNDMLNDTVINELQHLLKKDYPECNLQDPLLGQRYQFSIMGKNDFVQVLHNGNAHWIAISNIGCTEGEVAVLDSLFHGRITDHVKRQICNLLFFQGNKGSK